MSLAYLVRSGLGIPDYWHPRLDIRTDFLDGALSLYPVSMEAKADYPGEFSEDGVPVLFVAGRRRVVPVAVALYGLGSHDALILTGEERYRAGMFAALRWLERNCVPLGKGIGWPNHDDLPVYGLRAPWFSGIVNGLALSLFVRADRIQFPGRWPELARETWLAYSHPIENGGFRREIEQGAIYEEYPAPELDCVFNGMCHALIGLWEAGRSGLAPAAMSDFESGVRALRSLLPRFDRNGWSLYSLNGCLGRPLLASPYYQRANGLLAKVIGLMAPDERFLSYGASWLRASESLTRRIGMSLRIGLDRYVNAPALLHEDKSRPGRAS
jgi:hypothetical protein